MTPMTRKAAPSLLACLSVFQLDVKSRRLSPNSIRFYDQQLRYFLDWLEENGVSPDSVSITDLDRNDIRQEEIIESFKVTDWAGNLDVKQQIRRALDDHLYDLERALGLALSSEELDALIEQLLEIAVARDRLA